MLLDSVRDYSEAAVAEVFPTCHCLASEGTISFPAYTTEEIGKNQQEDPSISSFS